MKILREVPNLSMVPGKALNFSLLEFTHLCLSNIAKDMRKERKGTKCPAH